MDQTAGASGPSDGDLGKGPAKSSPVPTLYTSLARLRDDLSRLQERPNTPASLHLLDPLTANVTGHAPQSFVPGSDPSAGPSTGVSKAQFLQMISQMRQAARAFRKQSHVLATRDKPQSDQPQTATVDKYASLSRERSQHDAQLCANVKPLDVLQRHIRSLHSTLPPELVTGELLDLPRASINSQSYGKRGMTAAKEREASTRLRPRTSLETATGVLSALCQSLEALAKELGLETFAESLHPDQAAGDQLTPGQSRGQRTNMLTQGGKLLVIDYEMDVVISKTSRGQLRYAPDIQVKISFANESGGVHGSPMKAAPPKAGNSHNTALGELLRYDVMELAKLLFGLSRTESPKASLEESGSERRLRSAATHHHRLRENIQRLSDLDRLSSAPLPGKEGGASPTHNGDLFAAINALANVLSSVAQREHTSDSATEAPQQRELFSIQRGHGLPLQHCGIAGNMLVYDASLPELSGRSLRSRALGKRFDANQFPSSVVNELFCAELSIEPAPKVPSSSRNAAQLKLANGLDSASLPSLPDINAGQEHALGFCVRLKPSILLPRPLCARLASILGLTSMPTNTRAEISNRFGGDHSDRIGFWDLFGKMLDSDQESTSKRHSVTAFSSHADGIDVRFQLEDSATSPMQGHVISWFPFQNLAQLYAAVEVLQEASAVYKPLHRLAAAHATESGAASLNAVPPSSSGPTFVFDVTVPRPRQTGAFRLVLDCKIDTARIAADGRDPEVWLLSASFFRDPSAPFGYRVQGSSTNELSLLLGDSEGESSGKNLSEGLASELAETLSAREDLHEVARTLRDWACRELDLKLPPPATQQERAGADATESAEDLMEVDVVAPITATESDAMKMPPPQDSAVPAAKTEAPDEDAQPTLATVHEGIVSTHPGVSVKTEPEALPTAEREGSPLSPTTAAASGSTSKSTKRRRESRSPSVPRGTVRTRRRSQQQQIESAGGEASSSADPRHSPTLGSGQPGPRMTRRASAALSAASASPPRDDK